MSGIPVTISDRGFPVRPVEANAPVMTVTDSGVPIVQWVGFSNGDATLPQPAFGSISAEPSAITSLLGIYDDTNSNVYLAVFSGEWLTELSALPMSIGGTPFTPFDASVISGNTWVRYTGVGDWQDGALYQVEFG